MRSLRVLTVVGLSIGAAAVTAPGAIACLPDSFGSPQALGSGVMVQPGDQISFSIHAIGTDDSPSNTPYRITAGDVVVASGTAVADKGHETTVPGTFEMPPLGAFKGNVTVTLYFDDPNAQPLPFTVAYDGTPSGTGQQPAPVSPTASGTPPAASAVPVATPSGQPSSSKSAERATTPKHQPRVRTVRAPSAKRPAKQDRAVPTVRAADPPAAVGTAPSIGRVSAQPAPVAIARTEPARTPRAARHHVPANVAVRAMPRGVATEPSALTGRPAVIPVAARAERAADDAPTTLYAAGAVLLAILLGGGGLAAATVRRRRDEPEPPTDRLAEMEAELQEMVAEEKLRAEPLDVRRRELV